MADQCPRPLEISYMKRILFILSIFFSLQAYSSQFYWSINSGVGSLYYWVNGTGPGSEYFWKFGNGNASYDYWENGHEAGSKYYWNYGKEIGSKYYWNFGKGPGSKYYWDNGKGPGSLYFWKQGVEASFGPVITALCMTNSIDILACNFMSINSVFTSPAIPSPGTCQVCP